MPFDSTNFVKSYAGHKYAAQLANLDLAEKLWLQEAAPEHVSPRLIYETDCGTAGCFLWHVSRWEERRLVPPTFSSQLTGQGGLFCIRGRSPSDAGFPGSDYDLVLHRIARQRERLLAS